MRTRAARRGQAVVEMSIGMLVFITILIFAIHFGEISFLSIKTTEAAHSALLDATGHKLHDWPGSASASRTAATQAAADATARYRDFDSRTSTTGTGVMTLAFTQTNGMTVTCGGNGTSYNPHPFTMMAYTDGGGIRCQAQADLTSIRIPQRFMQNDASGFFKEEHYEMRPIRVCAIGRARGGVCNGGLPSMLDDWGLTGSDESGICPIIPDLPVPCPNNVPYWTMASLVYASSLVVNAMGPDFSGSRLAQTIVGGLPLPFFFGAENMFWMSSMGENTGFMQPIPAESMGGIALGGFKYWPTTPGALPPGISLDAIPYPLSYGLRDSCFLGNDCP